MIRIIKVPIEPEKLTKEELEEIEDYNAYMADKNSMERKLK